MTRGPPVRHEWPWKTSLPFSLAVEQSHGDDLTRSLLCKLTTPGGKASVGQRGPTPSPHLQSKLVQSECGWSYFDSKCSDKESYITEEHERIHILSYRLITEQKKQR